MKIFSDPLHDEFAAWPIGFAPYGGGDVGEVEARALLVKAGNDGSFFDAFSGLARRRIAEGDAAEAKGHHATAYDCYLRAAVSLGVAYHPLFGTPVDPRLVDAFHLQMATFDKALACGWPDSRKVDVPYESTRLPAVFVPAPGHEHDVRPVILVGGGWDSTMVENFVGMGVAALHPGYHVLAFGGPGQGRLLVDEGRPLRHDWETVVTPVVDAALEIDVIDPDRIVYEPWSLGGYMAPRAAARLPQIDPTDAEAVMKVVEGDQDLNWKIAKRGFWTNGPTDLQSWLVEVYKWKLEPAEVAAVTCPVVVTAAQSDMASSNAKDLFDALTGPKTFLQFTDADGAGMHCEMLNRSMANRQILDWLDERL